MKREKKKIISSLIPLFNIIIIIITIMCRQSMDMLTSVSASAPGLSFLRRIGSTGTGSSLSSLTIPLFPETSDDPITKQDQDPTSTSSLVQSSLVPAGGCPKISASELPPPQQQCSSFLESVINGDYLLPSTLIFQLRRITNKCTCVCVY